MAREIIPWQNLFPVSVIWAREFGYITRVNFTNASVRILATMTQQQLPQQQQFLILPTPTQFTELIGDVIKGKKPQDKEAALKTLVAIELVLLIESEQEQVPFHDITKDSDNSFSSDDTSSSAFITATSDSAFITADSSSESETEIERQESSESETETETQEITETEVEWRMTYLSKLRSYMKR